jgi:hypothetical protein
LSADSGSGTGFDWWRLKWSCVALLCSGSRRICHLLHHQKYSE